MNTLVVCPYCGVRLRASSMRAHIAMCTRCSGRSVSDRDISVETARRGQSTTTNASYESGLSPCVAALIPSRSPSYAAAPTVVRLDLRSASGEKSTLNDVAVHNLWSCPKSTKEKQLHYRLSCSSSLPSPPRACDGDAQPSANVDSAVSAYPSCLVDMWGKNPDHSAQHGTSEDTTAGAGAGSCAATPFADPNLVERISVLETANAELHMALEAERRARQESQKKFEKTLNSADVELATLRALVVAATKSAEAAHYTVKKMEKRLENVPTRDAVRSLQCKVDSLRTSPSALQFRQRTPREAVCRSTSATIPTGSSANVSVDTIRTAACGEADGHGRRWGHDESPFLHRDAAETVAQLLHLPPAATVHIHDSNLLTAASASPPAVSAAAPRRKG